MEFFEQTNPLAHKLFIGSVEPVSYAVVVGFEILRLIVSPARGGLHNDLTTNKNYFNFLSSVTSFGPK